MADFDLWFCHLISVLRIRYVFAAFMGDDSSAMLDRFLYARY